MPEFNKEKALDDLMLIFKPIENPRFSEQMKQMHTAQNFLEVIYLEGFQRGLETGLCKIEIQANENN